jgi:ketosteroid isomerase-like protein
VPWFPDFVSAVELVRQQSRTAGQADPVEQYLTALSHGDPSALETVWPGEVVVYDPRAGEIRGHKQLREYVHRNRKFLAERHARIETIATTCADGRAVVELVAHLADEDGREVAWPVAVVAESSDDASMVFRTYCSQWPVDGKRHLRPPILMAGDVRPNGVVGHYQAELEVGDAAAMVDLFAPNGYFRESFGPSYTHRGADELRALFADWFSDGAGIGQQPCVVTDDGERCAVEYNCVSWGGHDLAPQAGIAIYERGADERLAAVRMYDDVEPPVSAE